MALDFNFVLPLSKTRIGKLTRLTRCISAYIRQARFRIKFHISGDINSFEKGNFPPRKRSQYRFHFESNGAREAIQPLFYRRSHRHLHQLLRLLHTDRRESNPSTWYSARSSRLSRSPLRLPILRTESMPLSLSLSLFLFDQRTARLLDYSHFVSQSAEIHFRLARLSTTRESLSTFPFFFILLFLILFFQSFSSRWTLEQRLATGNNAPLLSILSLGGISILKTKRKRQRVYKQSFRAPPPLENNPRDQLTRQDERAIVTRGSNATSRLPFSISS